MNTEPKPYISIDSIGGSCPTQADGELYGYPFYFRARHGEWTLDVVMPGQDQVLAENPFVHMEGDDDSQGFMPIPEAMRIIGEAYHQTITKHYKPK